MNPAANAAVSGGHSNQTPVLNETSPSKECVNVRCEVNLPKITSKLRTAAPANNRGPPLCKTELLMTPWVITSRVRKTTDNPKTIKRACRASRNFEFERTSISEMIPPIDPPMIATENSSRGTG